MKYIDNEELCFWWLYDIMYNKNWRLICKKNTPKLISLIKSWRSKIYNAEPKLYKKLAKYQVPFLGLFTQYYITVFIYKCPVDVVWRIFDVFLFEGEKIITHIIIKLYRSNKEKLMSLNQEKILNFLSDDILANYLKSKPVESLFT